MILVFFILFSLTALLALGNQSVLIYLSHVQHQNTSAIQLANKQFMESISQEKPPATTAYLTTQLPLQLNRMVIAQPNATLSISSPVTLIEGASGPVTLSHLKLSDGAIAILGTATEISTLTIEGEATLVTLNPSVIAAITGAGTLHLPLVDTVAFSTLPGTVHLVPQLPSTLPFNKLLLAIHQNE